MRVVGLTCNIRGELVGVGVGVGLGVGVGVLVGVDGGVGDWETEALGIT